VIGRHDNGSSDPALWPPMVVAKLEPASVEDARSALQGREFPAAGFSVIPVY
jgi:hypothetical protein